MADKFVRLSDVEEMLAKANTVVHYNSYYETMENGYLEDDIDLSQLPVADVAPVVHGHWETILDELGNYGFEKCSACGDKYGSFTYRYCPNCGAKMDERVGTYERH